MASPSPEYAANAAPDDLTEILATARAGERRAFEELHARFARTVHGIALAQAGPDDADDVTQEVFLLIQARIDTVADGDALPGWICSVARNAAIDALRRRRRRPHHEALPELPAREQRTDDRLAEHVLQRVRELPVAYRETLTLRLVEGLTGPEIATATGMTHGSVRVNLHRGMALLRDKLHEDGWP